MLPWTALQWEWPFFLRHADHCIQVFKPLPVVHMWHTAVISPTQPTTLIHDHRTPPHLLDMFHALPEHRLWQPLADACMEEGGMWALLFTDPDAFIRTYRGSEILPVE